MAKVKREKVPKKVFVETVVFNTFSDKKKTNLQLASELGISEKWFYELYDRYAEDIDAAIDKRLKLLRSRALGGLDYHIRAKNLDAVKTALKISGDLKERVEHTGKDGEPITVKIDM